MPSVMKSGALALACATVASAAKSYTLDASDKYEGANFFDKFDFFTGLDPTRGYVQYQSASDAASTKFGSKLVETQGTQNYIGVDYTNTYDPIGAGRPSVRIESKNVYNHGLFLLDLEHMPASVCGTWPAFWTFSDVNYPSQGEIDILENIHENTVSLNVLHTAPGFSVAGNEKGLQQTGIQSTYNCDDTATSSDYGSQYLNQGCASTNPDTKSYGSGLNAAGGGVYAMEWTSDVIRVWNFAAGKVPSDITSGTPDPSTWGLPSFTTAQGKGDIDSHFKDHKVVIDTTFCGNWAGQDVFWKQTSCYDPVKYPTCSSYVGANPAKYKDAYWLVNSLKVYQLTDVVTSSSSSSSTSTTSSSSSVASTSAATPTTSASLSSSTLTSASSSNVASTSATSSSTSSSTSNVVSTSAATATVPTTGTSSSNAASTSAAGLSTSASGTNSSPSSSSTGFPATSVPLRNSSIIAHPTLTGSVTALPTVGSGSGAELTTSTVYTTSTGTVTSCAPTVTNCPLGSVTTVTIPLYTTVCPVSEANGGKPTTTPSSPLPTGYTTSTVYSTSTGTVTKCPATVTNCPLGSVTTVVVPLYTTVCPIESNPTPSGKPPGSPSGPGSSPSGKPPGGAPGSPSSPTTSIPVPAGGQGSGTPTLIPAVSVPVPAGGQGSGTPSSPSKPSAPACGGPGSPACPSVGSLTLVYTPTQGANGTATPTGGLTGSVSATPFLTTNGAGALRVGGAMFVGLIAALLM